MREDAHTKVVGEHSDGRPASSVAPDVEKAKASAGKQRHARLERAHKTLVPPGEAPSGAPRSGSA